MIIKHGDLFTTDNYFIGHGVNVDGKMGSGIAVQVRNKFPQNYENYKAMCDKGTLTPGSVTGWAENDKLMVHLATQDRPGANARYEWVFSACHTAALKITASDKPWVLSIPQIGAGIGGLEWYKVATILDCIETLVDGFEFEVWIYDGA